MFIFTLMPDCLNSKLRVKMRQILNIQRYKHSNFSLKTVVCLRNAFVVRQTHGRRHYRQDYPTSLSTELAVFSVSDPTRKYKHLFRQNCFLCIHKYPVRLSVWYFLSNINHQWCHAQPCWPEAEHLQIRGVTSLVAFPPSEIRTPIFISSLFSFISLWKRQC